MLKKNILANYIGQAYASLIVIAVTPFYINYFGIQQYALIGLFVLIQMCLNVLDVGFTPALSREVAYAKGKNDYNDLFRLVKAVEIIFIVISVSIVAIFYFFSKNISSTWANSSQNIDKTTITSCIFIMGIIVSVRFFTTMYKSCLNGFEDQVWINKFNIVMLSLKYPISLVYICFISSSVDRYFEYQLVLCIIEALIYTLRFYKKLREKHGDRRIFLFDYKILIIKLPYCMSVGYTSLLIALLMQSSQLLLAKNLTLTEFGYMSTIAVVTNGVLNLVTPLFLAIVPRLINYFANGEILEMKQLYTLLTKVVVWVLFSTVIIICFYSSEIIYCLTGLLAAAEWSKNILILFVLGNLFMILGSFQYYLQSVFGSLRIYVKTLTVGVIIYIPIVFFSAINYGAIGCGLCWMIFNLFWFMIVTPIVHIKKLGQYHAEWLIKTIIPLMIYIAVAFFFITIFVSVTMSDSRMFILMKLSIINIVLLLLSSFFIKEIRDFTINKVLHRSIL